MLNEVTHSIPPPSPSLRQPTYVDFLAPQKTATPTPTSYTQPSLLEFILLIEPLMTTSRAYLPWSKDRRSSLPNTEEDEIEKSRISFAEVAQWPWIQQASPIFPGFARRHHEKHYAHRSDGIGVSRRYYPLRLRFQY